MTRGLIEGKKAREYDKKVSSSKKSSIFNNFILSNIKSKNVKVCDLCCGSGNTINLLKNKVNEIIGVDASSEMIKICKEKFGKNKKIKLILSSVTKTKLKSNYFDYVIVRMGLHHIKEKREVLNEIYRTLKPKGKLILIDKYYLNWFEYYIKESLDLIFKFDKGIIDHSMTSKSKIFSLLNKFKILKEEYQPRRPGKTTQAFLFVLEKN
jgi:ubiquinone/menaquinone biosynthesis C-methylase UbiE